MTTAVATMAPAEELRTLQRGIAECNAALNALPSRTDLPPHVQQQYQQQATAYLTRATARIWELRRSGVAVIPAAPMTPAQASKATKKVAKQQKKAAKREAMLKGMASQFIAKLPEGSAQASAARMLMDGGKDKAQRNQALMQLVNSVPTDSPIAQLVQVAAGPLMEHFSDDDDEDDD